MHILFCADGTKAAPWVEALRAALPNYHIEEWQPGAPPADHAVVWSPPQQFFDEQYHQLADTMRRRMAYFQKEADEAANLWQDHFQALNRDNIYEKIVNYMAPFKNLHHQQAQLNAQHDLLSQSINRTHDRLMQKMADDAAVNAQLLQQMSTLNTLLEKSTAGGPVSRFVKKVFTGSTPSKSKT